MCLLIVLRGFHRDHPVVVGGNRDERMDRKASPPGLWVGERRRILSPRDRIAGGTWLAVDDRGRFAGITNFAEVLNVEGAPSRGLLPHLALEQEDLDAAIRSVVATVGEAPYSGFQLVLCDGDRAVVVQNSNAGLRVIEWSAPVLMVTNEHGPGDFAPRGLIGATAQQVNVERQLDALVPLLADRGGEGHHEISKHGECYGTVSSSLIAVPAANPTDLIWRFAPGPPDTTAYRNYGNLGRRLLPEDPLPEEPLH